MIKLYLEQACLKLKSVTFSLTNICRSCDEYHEHSEKCLPAVEAGGILHGQIPRIEIKM